MKIIHEFTIREEDCPAGIFDSLLSLVEEYPWSIGRPGKRVLPCGFEAANSKLFKFMDILSKAGLTPRNYDYPRSGSQYSYQIQRVYTHTDLLKFKYLQFDGGFGEAWTGWLTDDRQRLILMKERRPKVRKGASDVSSGLPLCTTSLRENIEAQQYRHIAFRPTELRGDPTFQGDPPRVVSGSLYDWSDIKSEPWWQITSDLTLPPLSPNMDLESTPGQIERVVGVTPREGAYAAPELHYRRQDFDGLPDFDAALTYEHIRGLYDFQNLIVSTRFYKFSHENRLPWKFLPVHVDP